MEKKSQEIPKKGPNFQFGLCFVMYDLNFLYMCGEKFRLIDEEGKPFQMVFKLEKGLKKVEIF